MRAADIMSAPVVSVGPDTSVKEIAALLFEKRISAVPVLDEGRLIGLVSEGDLLRRKEIGTDRAVTDGIVHYFGTIQSDEQQDAARVAAENSSGVRGVEDHRVPFYR